MDLFLGIMIPFIGTTLGSACVFFMKKELSPLVQKVFLGFASGVMVAASVWSLLIPAMDMSEPMGKFAFIPAAAGFLGGIAFLLAMDRAVPHLHLGSEESEGPKVALKKTTMLVLAVTLHNIPEGLSAGAVLAGAAAGNASVTMAGALTLSLGIAIQNFPEGAIISMPLRGAGVSRRKSFVYGALSGVVEPLAAALTLLLASGSALSSGFCRRSHDLCGGGRTDPRGKRGRAQQYGHHCVCCRLRSDDDTGCGAWMICPGRAADLDL